MTGLKFALRQLAKHPLANAVIVVTIGLLVGALSTIYAGLRASERQAMPFPKPEQVVKLWRTGGQQVRSEFPADVFAEMRRGTRAFAELGAVASAGKVVLHDAGEAESVNVARATAAAFRLLGLPPHRGRYFSEDEERTRAPVVVLSHELWQRRFGGDDVVVGQTLRLDDRSLTVIGVAPPALERSAFGPPRTDVWQPYEFRVWGHPRDGVLQVESAQVIGRLGDGWTRGQAQAEISTLSAEVERSRTPQWWERREVPEGYSGVRVTPLNGQVFSDARMRGEVFAMAAFLSVVAVCVVLIACFNVTNLLLLRAGAREREVAIRASLGCSRGRLVRQFLGESCVLGLLGGLAGLVFAAWIMAVLRSQHLDPRFDHTVFLVAFALAVLLGLGVGIVPALRGARCDLTRMLKDGGSATGSRRRHRLRNLLVAAQIGMALVLCVAGALFTRAFMEQQFVRSGFNEERMLMLQLALRGRAYETRENRIAYAQRALRALEGTFGLRDAALASPGGVLDWNYDHAFDLEAGAQQPERSAVGGLLHVSPNFHRLVGLRLIRGRELSPDRGVAEAEAVVSQGFAERHFPGQEPLGRRLRLTGDADAPWLTIVGVAENRPKLAGEPRDDSMGEVHLDYRHGLDGRNFQLLAATEGPAAPMAKGMREALRALDAAVPVAEPGVVAHEISKARRGPRNVAMLFLSLATCGLLLAVVGLYGVVASAALERTREIGIRMALGADRADVLRLLLRQGLRLIALGVGPGILIAWAVTQGLPKVMLGGMSPRDPWTHFAALVLIVGTALLASLIPARRAARLKPETALRYE